jgi:hypothetical protein
MWEGGSPAVLCSFRAKRHTSTRCTNVGCRRPELRRTHQTWSRGGQVRTNLAPHDVNLRAAAGRGPGAPRTMLRAFATSRCRHVPRHRPLPRP